MANNLYTANDRIVFVYKGPTKNSELVGYYTEDENFEVIGKSQIDPLDGSKWLKTGKGYVSDLSIKRTQNNTSKKNGDLIDLLGGKIEKKNIAKKVEEKRDEVAATKKSTMIESKSLNVNNGAEILSMPSALGRIVGYYNQDEIVYLVSEEFMDENNDYWYQTNRGFVKVKDVKYFKKKKVSSSKAIKENLIQKAQKNEVKSLGNIKEKELEKNKGLKNEPKLVELAQKPKEESKFEDILATIEDEKKTNNKQDNKNKVSSSKAIKENVIQKAQKNEVKSLGNIKEKELEKNKGLKNEPKLVELAQKPKEESKFEDILAIIEDEKKANNKQDNSFIEYSDVNKTKRAIQLITYKHGVVKSLEKAKDILKDEKNIYLEKRQTAYVLYKVNLDNKQEAKEKLAKLKKSFPDAYMTKITYVPKDLKNNVKEDIVQKKQEVINDTRSLEIEKELKDKIKISNVAHELKDDISSKTNKNKEDKSINADIEKILLDIIKK